MHEPRGDSRPRLSSRAQLDRFLPGAKIAEPRSAGQPVAAVPTWFVHDGTMANGLGSAPPTL